MSGPAIGHNVPMASPDNSRETGLHPARLPGATVRHDLLMCEECDAVHHRPRMARRDMARCRRCGATLARGAWLTLDGQLAIAVAAAVVFVIASTSPIVTLALRGVVSQASLWEATQQTWLADEHIVAALAFFTAFVFPLLVIGLRLWVLAFAMVARAAPGFARALRALRWAARWSMVEVFMLGILIAVVRSAGVADVVLGPGIFGYAMLTVLITAMQSSSLHTLWRRAPMTAANP